MQAAEGGILAQPESREKRRGAVEGGGRGSVMIGGFRGRRSTPRWCSTIRMRENRPCVVFVPFGRAGGVGMFRFGQSEEGWERVWTDGRMNTVCRDGSESRGQQMGHLWVGLASPHILAPGGWARLVVPGHCVARVGGGRTADGRGSTSRRSLTAAVRLDGSHCAGRASGFAVRRRRSSRGVSLCDLRTSPRHTQGGSRANVRGE